MSLLFLWEPINPAISSVGGFCCLTQSDTIIDSPADSLTICKIASRTKAACSIRYKMQHHPLDKRIQRAGVSVRQTTAPAYSGYAASTLRMTVFNAGLSPA